MDNELLVNFLTNVVFPIAGAALSVLLTLLIHKLAEKAKVSLTIEQENVLLGAAATAVQYAEELALTKARGAEKMTGNEKFDAAMAFVMKSVPKVDEEKARAVLLAAVQRVRS